MRFAKTLVLATLFVTGSALAAAKVGDAAPNFTLPGSDGKPHSLAEYKGKNVVLEWTNDGCPFVKKHYGSGNMQSLQKEAQKDGAVWLSIISSAPGQQGNVSAQRAAELSKERGATPTVVLIDDKGTVGHLYDAKTTPHMFIVDKTGKLVYAGGIDSIASSDPEDIASAKPYVKTALAEVTAGKSVTTAVTKPYGCGIKY